MPTYSFPSSASLQRVERDLLPRLERDRPVFDWFPIVSEDTDTLMWEQEDAYIGLGQVRGLNGEPPRVKRTGMKRYVMEPGCYGEYEPIDEKLLTSRRRVGSFNAPMSVDDLVMPIQEKLLGRRLDRMEWIAWTLMATGTFSVPGPNGAILHTDSYTFQAFTAAVAWSTFATSTPLADFSAVQLLARGHSVDFGAAATAYMNRATFNNLRSNTNNADIYGRRTQGFGTINNLVGINQLLQGDDLPTVVVYDRSFLDDTGAVQLYIPNNKVIVVGRRPGGRPIGDFCLTRNANNPDLGPGAYTRVIDKGEMIVPRTLEVHDGWNGGIRIYWPSSIVVMSV